MKTDLECGWGAAGRPTDTLALVTAALLLSLSALRAF